jgi:hypothetical protein
MKKYAVMLGLLAMGVGAFASNITIYDGNSNGYLWHGVNEDQEVEPGCEHGQVWDLEAFTLSNDNKLGMIGGYNFIGGYGGTRGGDIFISVGGDKSTYEYAIDLAFNAQNGKYEYKVYNLIGSYVLSTCTDVSSSSPWQLASGGVPSGNSGVFTYTNYGDSQGTHYVIDGIDLSFLNGQSFYSHYTMSCGNDNMMGYGKTTSVPEPGSLILFGTGLLGLLGLSIGRRKK